jgi:hypothetical protein
MDPFSLNKPAQKHWYIWLQPTASKPSSLHPLRILRGKRKRLIAKPNFQKYNAAEAG